MISKSDFMRYLDNPLHMWARQHGQVMDKPPSLFGLHLMEQGKEVEKWAKRYIYEILSPQVSDHVDWQPEFKTAELRARADAIIYNLESGKYDLCEIKSSTRVKKEHILDAAFQAYVSQGLLELGEIFILHLNKDFVRSGELELSKLFIAKNITKEVNKLQISLPDMIGKALEVANASGPTGLDACLSPADCPCPQLCHPDLAPYSIYDISHLNRSQALLLRGMGINSITDVPDNFELNPFQVKQVQAAKTGEVFIDHDAIAGHLATLEYPLYFLDYEALNSAIPLFDGYKPYQFATFQYSLHVVMAPGQEPIHYDFLDTDPGDPDQRLIPHLIAHLGENGSVVVWNKAFEQGRHNEFGMTYPEYSREMDAINKRIFDLMEIFRLGLYVHPGFRGSYSIKNVLPVLAPDLSYNSLPISHGDQAMLTWYKIIRGELPVQEIEATRKPMLSYCEMDSLAMVRIWEHLTGL